MRLLLKRAAVGAIALAVSVSLAGCDEDDGPNSAPPSDSSSVPETSSPTEPTTTPTETGPVEPTIPAEAETATKAGVEAFVAFYWEVVNYATKTGDVRLLEELDQPSCEGCAGGIEGISRIYEQGGRIVGGDYSVVRLEPVQSATGRWTVVAHTKVGTQRAVDAGDLNTTYPAGRDKWLIGLARADKSWSVSTLESL